MYFRYSFFESLVLYLENTLHQQPIAQQKHKCLWLMHVSGHQQENGQSDLQNLMWGNWQRQRTFTKERSNHFSYLEIVEVWQMTDQHLAQNVLATTNLPSSQNDAGWRVKVEEQLRDDMWSGHTSKPHQVLQNRRLINLNWTTTCKLKNVHYSQDVRPWIRRRSGCHWGRQKQPR